jgi:hypothetical protein
MLTALLMGCGSDDKPLSHSAPIGINLKVKAGDAKNGALSDEKGITTESGNPYGAFIKDARDKLEGATPTRVTVDSVTLLLGGDSKGVTSLEQVFAGVVETLFQVGDSKNTYPVGKVTDPKGSGPVSLSADFDSTELSPTDRDKLTEGGFDVVIRGTAASGFTKAEADLQLTFTFNAYK